MSNFQPLEVVGRGRETQLQVGKNLNYLYQQFRVEFGLMYSRLSVYQPL